MDLTGYTMVYTGAGTNRPGQPGSLPSSGAHSDGQASLPPSGPRVKMLWLVLAWEVNLATADTRKACQGHGWPCPPGKQRTVQV